LSAVALLPIVLLLGSLTVLGWSAPRSAIVSWILAVLLAVTLYGMGLPALALALGKAMLLTLFVLLIVWAALLLHSLLSRLGAIETIGIAMMRSAHWPAARALLIGWGFSGFIQGFAGFGAPVASVVPLLQVAGFGSVEAAAAAMVGHSWAITFGSMGSSFFAIQLVTRIPGEVLAPWLGLLFVAPILISGLAVLHLLLGWRGLWQGGPLALISGGVMAAGLWLAAILGAGAVASVLAALAGCATLLALATGFRLWRREPRTIAPAEGPNIHLSLLPYYLLISLTLLAQAGPVADLARRVVVGVDFPSTMTGLGYIVAPETTYPRLRLLQHPATVILVAIALTALVYRARGLWPTGAFWSSVGLTYRRSKNSSITVIFMVMMALVMADAGMMNLIADGLRALVGPAFPLLSPFLGVLGAFMTGSNTNSNVAMGVLQVETAAALGLVPALIAAAQSVGGSIGAGVSPDKAAIGASAAGIQGQEAAIMRRALPYALLATLVVGIEVLALTRLTLFTP
jgi:lactate permease